MASGHSEADEAWQKPEGSRRQQDEILARALTLPPEDDSQMGADDMSSGVRGHREDSIASDTSSLDPSDSARGYRHASSSDIEAAMSERPSTMSYSSSMTSSAAYPPTPISYPAAAMAGTAPLRDRSESRFSATTTPPPSRRVTVLRWTRNIGLLLLAIGLVALGSAIVSHTYLPEWRDKRALESLVVDSPDHPNYAAWVNHASPSSAGRGQGDSPTYQRFYFFHLVNSKGFLQGKKPFYLEKGPYTFRQTKKKVDVNFSEKGTLVSYVTLVQNKYSPEQSGKDVALSDTVTMLNLAYATAVATFGSESNLLRYGSRRALMEIERAWESTFLPTLKERAVAATAVKTLALIDEALTKLNYQEDGTAIRWGGGCASAGMVQQCGFEKAAFLMAMIGKERKEDAELYHMCLDTGLGSEPGQAIPLETVKALWDTSDRLSIFNVETVNSTVRFGISYWLNADANMRDTLLARFRLNTYQYTMLTTYLRRIYDSPLLETFIIKNFLSGLPPGEVGLATAEIADWSSLTWRQWAVGDVLQTFSGAVLPESVLPETPPELSFYMAAVGQPVWTPVGIVVGENEVPPPISPARWSLKQTKCMRDLILRETDADFFAETVLGLPPSPTQTSRKTFLDVESAMARSPEASKAALEQCLVSQGAWSVMLGYFDYLGRTFAGPHLREHVVEANGGLIVTRSVQSWLEGRPEPILSSSLPPNDPRIWFGIMTDDEKMEAPGKCVQVSDIENMYSACSPVTAPTDPTTLLYYKKVANTYHTGKKHPDRLGAMAKYKGDEVAWGIWPQGKIPILGGAATGQGSVVQYGYSEGEQFPPLNRILRATEAYVGPGLVAGLENTFNSLAATENATTTTAMAAMAEETVESPTDMLVFMSNFVLPVRFQYRGPRGPIQGLTGLHRFGLSPLNFSPRRRDAALYSMDGPQAREGLLNMTDIKGAPFFLSPPHYLGCPKLQSLECLSAVATIPQGESEAAVGSHLDIEPYTGRTLSASVSLQVSSSTMGAARAYDVFHTETYAAEVVPLLWMTHQAEVGPEDAALFQELVNAPLDFVTKVQRLTLLVGILTAGVGLFLALLGFFCLCRKSGRESKTESDARRARGHFI